MPQVLVPYKITLLSNNPNAVYDIRFVLVPYKITLLSNAGGSAPGTPAVLVPYKITLLSNCVADTKAMNRSFSTL